MKKTEALARWLFKEGFFHTLEECEQDIERTFAKNFPDDTLEEWDQELAEHQAKDIYENTDRASEEAIMECMRRLSGNS